MTFTNESMWDRVIRVLIAIAFGYAAWMAWPGAAPIVYLVIGAIALVTGFVGWCPIYAFFNISTKKKVAA